MNDTAKIIRPKKNSFDIFVKTAIIIIAAVSILAAIKCIIVGLQRDEEYALSLSYRLINGDKLLTQVWDPHQTSAFLLSLIEWIFIKVTGGTTYLVLWCKIAGTLIHAAIAFYLYRTLKFFAPRNISILLGLVYFGILPKDGIIPEFSIMLAWSITLIIIVLAKMKFFAGKLDLIPDDKSPEYIKNKRKIIILCVFLALFSFGMMLSYPSTVLVVPFIYAFLIIDRKKNPKAVLIVFPSVLIGLSLAYLGYLFSYMTLSELITNIFDALKACGSHNYRDEGKGVILLKNIGTLMFFTSIAAVFSFIICFVTKLFLEHKTKAKIKIEPEHVIMIAIILGAIAQIFFCAFGIFEYLYSYELSYFFWIFAFKFVIMIRRRKIAYSKLLLRFLILNILSFLAVIVLTNLTIFTSIPYCISGLVVSLLAIFLYADKKSVRLRKLAVITILAVALSNNFFKGFSYSSNDGYNWNVLCANKLIHSGAAKGIVTEYMTGYINEKAKEDWENLIKDGDNVLVWDFTSLYYLNKDVNIASYTTISTPTYYVDSLKKYWSNNPDKYPDVIAVSVWFGDDYRMEDCDHFLDWIENEFDADEVVEKEYYRYYIRRR